jgi:hypothetical protein
MAMEMEKATRDGADQEALPVPTRTNPILVLLELMLGKSQYGLVPGNQAIASYSEYREFSNRTYSHIKPNQRRLNLPLLNNDKNGLSQ